MMPRAKIRGQKTPRVLTEEARILTSRAASVLARLEDVEAIEQWGKDIAAWEEQAEGYEPEYYVALALREVLRVELANVDVSEPYASNPDKQLEAFARVVRCIQASPVASKILRRTGTAAMCFLYAVPASDTASEREQRMNRKWLRHVVEALIEELRNGDPSESDE